MDKKVIEWTQSNVEVQLTIDPKTYESLRESALNEFAKDIEVPWYRKGKAPADEVEKKVNPQYLETAIYEKAVNDSLKELTEKYKLIGQIYDVNPSKKDDNLTISFKVDVYPEVKVKNKDFENAEPQLPNKEVTEEEIQRAVEWLKRQFAEYKNVEKVNTEKTIVKLALDYLDANWEKVGDGKVFLAKEDFKEFPMLKDAFEGKENGYTEEFDYTEDLPQLLKYFKKDKDELDIKKVKASITEVKETELPELTTENLQKWFGKTYDKVEDFMEEVKNTLAWEKERNELAKFIEDLVSKIKSSFEVAIPKTLTDQEVKQRVNHLKQQYGGEKNFEDMLKSMKPEDVKKMYSELSQSSKESVEKFFILMKFAEEKGIADKIDFKRDLDLEKRLLALFDKKEKTDKNEK